MRGIKRIALAMVILLAACSPVGDGTDTQTPVPDAGQQPESAVTAAPDAVEPTPSADPSDPYEDYDLISCMDGSTATIPLNEEALKAYLGTNEGLLHNTTLNAYENLINGQKDMVLCTYPSENEFALAADAGVELEIVPVVKDALVFLNNTENPVENLTKQQIVDIYTGRITGWDSLGGLKQRITPYQREAGSGSQTLFIKLAMDGFEPMEPPSELRPGAMAGLIDAVADYDNAESSLGYSVFYYVSDMYSYPNIRLMSVDGVKPDRGSIASGEYPFVTYYYAVLRRDTPQDHPVRDYLRWMLSDQGQQTAQKAGYVPLESHDDTPDAAPVPESVVYPGATPENTLESAGTGGTKERRSEEKHYDWGLIVKRTDDYRMYVELPEDWVLEREINQWLDTVYAGIDNTVSAHIRSDSFTHNNMLSFLVIGEQDGVSKIHTVAFDMAAAKKLVLSDVFYDGVNYMKFINENLIDSAARWEDSLTGYSDFEDRYVKRPFTGYPNDYPHFVISEFDGTPLLVLYAAANDPFFNNNAFNYGHASLIITLPHDLSPWGGLWRMDYEGLEVKENVELAVPTLQLGSQPASIDGTINARIRAAAEKLIREKRYNDMEVGEGYQHKITPRVEIWGDNLTVGYLDSGTDNYVGRIDINMFTGATVDPRGSIPSKWWETHAFTIYSYRDNNLDFLLDWKNGYQPDGIYRYEDVWITSADHMEFVLVEPDRRLRVFLNGKR